MQEVTERLVSDLARAIDERDIPRAAGLLMPWKRRLALLEPDRPHNAELLDYAARWIDFDATFLTPVTLGLQRFENSALASASVRDLAHVDIARGLVAIHGEEYDGALERFGEACDIARRIGDDDLDSVALYYQARCFWRKTDYPAALEHIGRSKQLEATRLRPRRMAVIEMLEGWLHFQQGRFEEAKLLLGRADKELLHTKDYVNHGNALSFHGRLARREGRYREALRCFAGAVSRYSKDDPRHRNVARSHANMAFVYRLQALRLRESPVAPVDRGSRQAEIALLVEKVEHHLGRAEKIYKLKPRGHKRGRGAVHNMRALLHLDTARFDRAESEAERAFRLGRELNDHLLMANARIIQCMTANDQDRWYAALQLAEEAVEHAARTGNRRVQARAHLWRGETLVREPFNDPAGARLCCDAAARLISEGDRDYLPGDLQRLRDKIRRLDRRPEPVVRLERTEIVGSTLAEIRARVERAVIREVYELCGGRVNKAAKALRTGHRKIREALKGK